MVRRGPPVPAPPPQGTPLRTVTLREVAEECDLSIATVSAVANGAAWVPEDTRRRVQQAIDQLGYRPNQLARGLKTRRGHAVGVIVSDLTNPFFTEIIRSLSHALRESGRTLLLSDSDHRFEIGDLNLRMLSEGHVAGLVLIGDSIRVDTLCAYVRRPNSVPVIAIERDYEIDGVSCLLVDSELGAYGVTRHLIEQGYRRIGIISGPHEGPGSTTYGRAQRYDGYARALSEAGYKVNARLVAEGNFRYTGGREAMRRLLAGRQRPDAVFACNDMMALGAMEAVRAAGLRVPEDIALAGWDDIPITALTTPALTTVAMPKRQLGSAAANLLNQQLRRGGTHLPVRQMFDAQLIVRQSSGAA
ncbi:MAG TPA: LacI family DNA-binding transcriptional regulator [Gemmatimonadaceae bacterium]|nr:LacI family DNA-binding transcriptional regulator [Gemmatimonadaceae bacterium]